MIPNDYRNFVDNIQEKIPNNNNKKFSKLVSIKKRNSVVPGVLNGGNHVEKICNLIANFFESVFVNSNKTINFNFNHIHLTSVYIELDDVYETKI